MQDLQHQKGNSEELYYDQTRVPRKKSGIEFSQNNHLQNNRRQIKKEIFLVEEFSSKISQ